MWSNILQRRTSKRRFLVAAGTLTAAGFAAACGGSDKDSASAPASGTAVTGGIQAPAGGPTTTAAQPKRGGTLTIGLATNPAT